MRIAIDMDEVLADTHSAKLALYRERGYEWSASDMEGHQLSELARPEDRAAVEGILHRGLFFADLDVVEGAQAALEALGREHEIFIATAAMEYPASCPHKIAWMNRHFPQISLMNLVFCGDKSVVAADILVDDSPRHFTGFQGRGLCFDAPHNHGEAVEHRLLKWADAEATIAGMAS